jgi:hypothetical protein
MSNHYQRYLRVFRLIILQKCFFNLSCNIINLILVHWFEPDYINGHRIEETLTKPIGLIISYSNIIILLLRRYYFHFQKMEYFL